MANNHSKPQTFNSLSSENRHQRDIAHSYCAEYNRAPSKGNFKKIKKLFNSAGNNLIIERGFHCDYVNKISFGNDVYVNINCTMLDGGIISIGDNCLIGPNVQLITINHPLSPQDRLKKLSYAEDITIGNNVWIGASVIILPGVKIGDNSVIGANALVTRGDYPANTLYLGSPAVKVKPINLQ